MIPIQAIDGMPGVGKTALAVHAAHLLTTDFPDGQLFVDLRTHAPGQRPMAPADALAELLSADGVHQKEIPVGLDERASRWRARMANRKALIVIDNVGGYDDVEWLLPGSPGCLVLVTSRRRLTGLRVRRGAVLLSLEALPPVQAVELFQQVAQQPIDTPQQAEVAKLVRLCGYLPLAIVLLAAKVGPANVWQVGDLLAEVQAAHDRLEYMKVEDIAVAAAFDLSYRALPPSAGRLFRRLSLHPGTDIDAYAAAALADVTVARAGRSLDLLYDNHLLHQPVRGRYRMHDLVRAYASTLTGREPASEQKRHIVRLLTYYAHAAGAAADLIAPGRRHANASCGHTLPVLPNLNAAMAWMRLETANLFACATAAHRDNPHVQLSIAAAMSTYLARTGPWDQALSLQEAAIAAADAEGDVGSRADAMLARAVLLRQIGDYATAKQSMLLAQADYVALGDRAGQADTCYEMGSLYRMFDDFAESARVLQHALSTYRSISDHRASARTLSSLAAVHWLTDDFVPAAQALELALDIYRHVDDQAGRAVALFRLGVVKRLTDDYPGATTALQQALTIFTMLGDRLGEADTRHTLGVVARMTGQHAQAQQQLEHAMSIYVDLGDRLGQANGLKQIGVVHRLTGEHARAIAALEDALAIYDALGDRFARANVLAALGVARQLTGELQGAAIALAEARDIYHEVGSRLGTAEVNNALGALLLQQGQSSTAVEHHNAALLAANEARNSLEEANALRGIASCLHTLDKPAESINHLRQALEIYRRIGAPDARQAALDLAALESNISTR
jgi:tetratricopeptide (TPR) repeat protein